MLINGNQPEDVYKDLTEEIEESGNEEIKEWLDDSKSELPPKVSLKMGWVKHAFVFCLRYLRLAQTEPELDAEYYVKWIKEVLKAGGDTDTNACIVGGMLGAMIGFEKLPEKPKTAVLNRKNNNGIKRDQFLLPSVYAEKSIDKLFELWPDEIL